MNTDRSSTATRTPSSLPIYGAMENLNSLWAQASSTLAALRKASTVLHSAKPSKGPGKPKHDPLSRQQTEEDHLNALNDQSILPAASDVVVVGAGIHSLIYAIHTRLRSKTLLASLGQDDGANSISITVVERAASPGYKIGESTLTTFGVWLRSIGLSTALLWRLFGPKDGLAFYYLARDGGDDYTDFCANGPAGDFVATLQIERKISELLLTLFAQRLGVNIYYGHAVDIDSVQMPRETDSGRVKGHLHVADRQGASLRTEADLVIDATGRFRRFASKAGRSRRFSGFNTDAFWAYFEMPGDEADVPLRHYESCHTNHICLPEGWAWVIRLPSWEGSPLPNLIAMINHLLDLNAAQTAADDYPSSMELAERFGLKFRWVVSIGFALRSDVVYPDSLDAYGTCEAERKFNWITSQYPQMTALMQQHTLVRDLYGPGTTWFIRKSLSYQSPVAAGAGWAAVGDATGFTNPLYSPGINCNMGPSVWLAEQTPAYLSTPSPDVRRDIMSQYRNYCDARVPDLHRMNTFNYLMMRSSQTGPLGPLWQYLCGTGNADWRNIKSFAHIDRVAELVTRWEWGSQHPEYIAFADKAIKLLDGPPTEPSQETIDKVMSLSEAMLRRVVETGRFRNRWAGLLRYYDNDLRFCQANVQRDLLATRCGHCGNWRILTGDSVKCATCGGANKVVAIQRVD